MKKITSEDILQDIDRISKEVDNLHLPEISDIVINGNQIEEENE